MANNNVGQCDLFGQSTIAETQETQDELSFSSVLSGSQRFGRYAEFMVCAFLAEMGHQVFHVNAAGFDIVLEYQGFSYRVEVKSSSVIVRGPRKERVQWTVGRGVAVDGRGSARHHRTRRRLGSSDAELVALFYRPLDTVVFYPITKPVKHVLLPLSFVRNAGRGEATLGPAIKKVRRAVNEG